MTKLKDDGFEGFAVQLKIEEGKGSETMFRNGEMFGKTSRRSRKIAKSTFDPSLARGNYLSSCDEEKKSATISMDNFQ